MSTAIKDLDLTGQTIAYNDIRFDGHSSNISPYPNYVNIKMIPPTYSIDTTAVYDAADRAVVQHDHTLSVNTIIYSSDEVDQTRQVEEVRRRLLIPGQTLTLSGIGVGLPSSGDVVDIAWGPKPRSCDITPIGGTIAHELTWVVEFTTAPCDLSASKLESLTLKSLNYSTSWANNSEGITTRTISGYVEIIQRRQPKINASKTLPEASKFTADGWRKFIKVSVPIGFKQAGSSFRESADKSRIDFAFVDQQLQGAVYPDGIVSATGGFTEQTNPFLRTKASTGLNMTLTVAPDRHPSLASLHFFTIASAKQQAMSRASRDVDVRPVNLTIRSGLFDAARTTTFSIQWNVLGKMSSFMFSSPWEVVPNTDYQRWRSSVATAWNVHGSSGGGTDPIEDAIVNVCTGPPVRPIGRQSNALFDKDGLNIVHGLSCGQIDPDASWLDYDVQVSIKRDENATVHRRAVPYSGGRHPSASDSPGNLSGVLSPSYPNSPTTSDVTEYNGYPTQTVLLQMRGIRVGHKPSFPTLESFGGKPVEAIGTRKIEQKILGELSGCEVYSIRGYQIYSVKDHVRGFDVQDNPKIESSETKKGRL